MKPTQNDVDVAIKAAAKSTEEVKIFVTAFVKTKKRGKGVRVDEAGDVGDVAVALRYKTSKKIRIKIV